MKSSGEHVPADIEMQAAPAESRLVADANGGYRPGDAGLSRISKNLRWQKLPQRLHPAQKADPPACAQSDAFGRDLKRVRFVRHIIAGRDE